MEIGKIVRYGKFQGKVVEFWKLTDKMNLVKVDLGDSQFLTLSEEVVEEVKNVPTT